MLVLLCLVAVVPASAEGLEIKATPGDNVTMPCEAEEYVPFELVEWSKFEGNTENVLVYSSENSDPEIRENYYKGRLELKVTKNGEVPLILKNVTVEDSGTYKCYAAKQTTRSRRDVAPPKAISTIHLKVAPPADSHHADAHPADAPRAPSGRGHIGVTVGLVGAALVVVALVVVAAFIWKKRRIVPPHPHDEAVQTLQV